MAKITKCIEPESYDFIVVGSGNGACAFLHQYFNSSSDGKVLVLEEGDNFFETSDITHQRNWTQSYAEENIFKLHAAQTPAQIPILSGRACTMGGGGSINYTMIFESSAWLAEHFGRDSAYWDTLKQELADAFQLRNPVTNLTAVAKYVKARLENQGFTENASYTKHIPVYPDNQDRLIHIFPTQFNEFGQRVHSGISLLNWYENERLDFMTQRRVVRLHLEAQGTEQRCTAITVLNLETNNPVEETYTLGTSTKVLLCAGAVTPQLLYEYRETLQNTEIGQHVNDHILLPFGIYLLKEDLKVTLRDQYVSLFATTEEFPNRDGEEDPTVCNFDFFSGSLETLIYLVSHLFLAFWVPNSLKSRMIRNPNVFKFLKTITRSIVGFLICLGNFRSFFNTSTASKPNLISAMALLHE